MTQTPAGTGQPTLVRAIGRWDLTAIVINSVIGSAVFGLPATLVVLTGAWSPLAVVIGGLAALVIVLCFAEVASRFDEAGGPYLFARTAFGTFVGFEVGWLHLWTRLFSAAAVLNVFIDYSTPFFPVTGTPTGRTLTMVALTAVAAGINVIGVRQATWTVDLFTIGKLVPLGLLAILGLVHFSPDAIAAQHVAMPKWSDALVLAMFAYGGFESGIVAAGETRRPHADTAFALIAATAVIGAVYVAVQVAVLVALPRASASSAPVVDALAAFLGPAGAVIAGFGALISIYGWIAGFCMMTPRISYAMAARGELPAFISRVHPRFRTPYVSIIANASVALALALFGTFAGTATFSVLTRLVTFSVTCATLPVLRRRPGAPAGFMLPAGPLFSLVGIGYCVWLLQTRPLGQVSTLVVIAAAGAALWAFARFRRGAPVVEPVEQG